MKVDSLKTSILTPKVTGYAATAAIGSAMLSGVSKNKALRKTHTPFAVMASVFTALHVGLIEYYHHKYKKM